MLKVCVFLLSFSFMSVAAQRSPLDAETKKQVVEVLTAGDQLHESFFQYDSKKIVEAAKVVASKIDAIKDSKIKGLLEVTKEKLLSLKTDASEESNKDNFFVVSLGLGNIVRKYDVGGKWNVYSCPMVKKKWVQNSQKHDDIQNPYASGMPNCGSKDTNF